MRDPRVLNVTRKPRNLCAVFQCRRPTASGLPEKDLERRYCAVHMPSTQAKFQENMLRNKARSCPRNPRASWCCSESFLSQAGLSDRYPVVKLELAESITCLDPDNPFRIPTRRRCDNGFRKSPKPESVLWLIVAENQWRERLYVEHVPLTENRRSCRLPFTRWVLTRDHAKRFKSKYEADAHLERALRFLKVFDKRFLKNFRVVRYYPGRATRNREKGLSKEIFSHEFAMLASKTRDADHLRRRLFRILVEQGPLEKDALDRLHGQNTYKLMPTLVDRGKARLREDGRWEAVRSKDGEEFEV